MGSAQEADQLRAEGAQRPVFEIDRIIGTAGNGPVEDEAA